MRLNILFLFFAWLGCSNLSAQLRYGFKTGLNFASMRGPSEVDGSGANLEDRNNLTGFHIGVATYFDITDNFSVRGELLYSKKGTKYVYEGPSFYTFRYTGGSTYSTGKAKYAINVSNSYLELPIIASGRWKDFEVSAGIYGALLIGSTAEGAFLYTGARTAPPLNSAIDDLSFNLLYNYRKDAPGEYDGELTKRVRLDNANVDLPATLGAYYDQTEDNGPLYNSIDYGLVGGLSYYISRSLYIGGRFQYGLADLTNNDADVSRFAPNTDRTFLFRNDKDKNWTIQASVGFRF